MDWTAKYRPETLDAVRGNSDAIRDLREWAESWTPDSGAVILYGRPGIGKTTAAHALANEKDWEAIEMNASESRTQDVVQKIAGGAAVNGTLTGGTDGRRLVILDEADSLHGNVDRGGTKAMTDVVKNAAQPVILIANEFYEMSRSLRNSCTDIEFTTDAVSTNDIGKFLREICEQEDVDYTIDALKTIASKNSDDVRGAVNDLQAVATQVQGTLTKNDIPTGQRDTTEDLFPFMDELFQEATPQEAQELAYSVDETPDDLFAWVEDNVVKEYNADELAHAYEALARADEWLGRVRATQDYSYWRYVTDLLTSGVAAARRGNHSGWTRYGPPSYWQKLGSTKSKRNTRDYIARQIASTSNVSMGTARRDIMPFLAEITHHCKNRDATVAMAALYDLEADHISFITGSGEDTNKVQSIVEDAQELRDDVAFSAATTGKQTGFDAVTEPTSTTESANTPDNLGEDNTQQTLETAAEDTNDGSEEPVSGDTDQEQDTESDDGPGEQEGLDAWT